MDLYRIDSTLDSSPATLAALVATVGNDKTLIVKKNIQVSATINLATLGISIQFVDAGKFTVMAGQTLTMGTILGTPMWQIFDGLGTVAFDSVEKVLPQWYGATGNGTTDDTAAIEAADAAAVAAGVPLHFPDGTYQCDTDPVILSPMTPTSTGVLKWSGYHLTYTGSIPHDIAWQLFDFAVGDEPSLGAGYARAEWMGVDGTDDHIEINKALNSMPVGPSGLEEFGSPARSGTVELFSSKVYSCSAPIVFGNTDQHWLNVGLIGGNRTVVNTTSTTDILTVGNSTKYVVSCFVKGISFTTPSTTMLQTKCGIRLQGKGVTKNHFRDIKVYRANLSRGDLSTGILMSFEDDQDYWNEWTDVDVLGWDVGMSLGLQFPDAAATAKSCTVTTGVSTTLINCTGHDKSVGDHVFFLTKGQQGPGGLWDLQLYIVATTPDDDHITIKRPTQNNYDDVSGPTIEFTSDGGTFYMYDYVRTADTTCNLTSWKNVDFGIFGTVGLFVGASQQPHGDNIRFFSSDMAVCDLYLGCFGNGGHFTTWHETWSDTSIIKEAGWTGERILATRYSGNYAVINQPVLERPGYYPGSGVHHISGYPQGMNLPSVHTKQIKSSSDDSSLKITMGLKTAYQFTVKDLGASTLDCPNHTFSTGDKLHLECGVLTIPPDPLVRYSDYYAIVIDVNTLQVADTRLNALDGVFKVLSDIGSGDDGYSGVATAGRFWFVPTDREIDILSFDPNGTNLTKPIFKTIKNIPPDNEKNWTVTSTVTDTIETAYSSADFTANATTDELTSAGHTLVTGRTVVLSNSGGVLPGGLAENTVVFVYKKDANTIKVALTIDDLTNGVYIDVTDAGTGTHTFTEVSGFDTGDSVWVYATGGGALPTASPTLVFGTEFFWRRTGRNTGQLFDTYANAISDSATGKVDITSSGTPTLKIARVSLNTTGADEWVCSKYNVGLSRIHRFFNQQSATTLVGQRITIRGSLDEAGAKTPGTSTVIIAHTGVIAIDSTWNDYYSANKSISFQKYRDGIWYETHRDDYNLTLGYDTAGPITTSNTTASTNTTTGCMVGAGGLGIAGAGNFGGAITAGTSITATSGDITATNGDIVMNGTGKGLKIKSGANCRAGTATLVAGTVVVSNTTVTASTIILLTIQSLGTVTEPKAICVSARVANTSFTILSADNTDTSVIGWVLVEGV